MSFALILFIISITGCIDRTELPDSNYFRKIVDRNNSSTVHITRKGIKFDNKVISCEDSLINIFDSLESPPTPKILFSIDKDYRFQDLDTLIADLQHIRSRVDFYLKVNEPEDSCYLRLHFPLRSNFYNSLDSIRLYQKKDDSRFVFLQIDTLKRIIINNEVLTNNEAISILNQSFQTDTIKKGRLYYIEYNEYNSVNEILSLVNIYKNVLENQKEKFLKKHKIINDVFPNNDVEFEYFERIHRKEKI